MPISSATRMAQLALFALLPCLILAQRPFPHLKGETVDGRTVGLPKADGKAWTIVAVAYGKKAEPLLEDWYAPAYNRFIAKNGLFAGSYKADLFLVPLFTGANKAGYRGSMKQLRKNTDPDIARRVLFVKDDAKALIQKLGLKDKRIPYFFTLDPQGRIVQEESGAFSVAKLDALEAPML